MVKKLEGFPSRDWRENGKTMQRQQKDKKEQHYAPYYLQGVYTPHKLIHRSNKYIIWFFLWWVLLSDYFWLCVCDF